MKYARMAIERESPEEIGYGRIENNLSESSIRDLSLSQLDVDLSGLTLFYGGHRGDTRLRELVAQAGAVAPEEVLVTAGAACALFIVATSQLERDDHLVVVRPNYATNIATPQGIGCAISFVGLARFHRRLLADHGTYVGAGHWFDMPEQFIRIGFDWPTEAELRHGLAGISGAMQAELDAG